MSKYNIMLMDKVEINGKRFRDYSISKEAVQAILLIRDHQGSSVNYIHNDADIRKYLKRSS